MIRRLLLLFAATFAFLSFTPSMHAQDILVTTAGHVFSPA